MAARAKIMAERLFQGNTLAEEFLRWHMEFQGEARVTESPYMVDGIPFYQVGRNTSHEFFAGMRDGQLYRCAIGEEIAVDEQGNELLDEEGEPRIVYEPHVTEARDLSGYWGHF